MSYVISYHIASPFCGNVYFLQMSTKDQGCKQKCWKLQWAVVTSWDVNMHMCQNGTCMRRMWHDASKHEVRCNSNELFDMIRLPRMSRECSRSANSWETFACIQSHHETGPQRILCHFLQWTSQYMHSFSALQSVMIRLSRDQCSPRDLTSSIAKLVTVFNEVYHRNSEVVTLCSLAE